MTKLASYALAAGGFALVLTAAAGALALESHADATAPTKPAACKLALSLARQDISPKRERASHCECLEDKDDHEDPWSCTAFVSYR